MTWKIGESLGWCATCIPEAKKGQPGYCGLDQNMLDDVENKEILDVKPDSTNWGICDPKCNVLKPKDGNILHVRCERYTHTAIVFRVYL